MRLLKGDSAIDTKLLISRIEMNDEFRLKERSPYSLQQ